MIMVYTIEKPVEEWGVKELNEAERMVCEEDPFRLVEGGFLTIKTKAGEMVELSLNEVQKKVLGKVKERWLSGKPVRMWILKARQTGISTLVEALVYAFTSMKNAVNSLVVADDVDGANYIFSMQKLFHEKLGSHLKPDIKHSNEKKLEFESTHSQVLIDTAENLKAGRKYTFRAVHLSEVAYFRDLEQLMLGLNQAVPNLKETFVIGETTANGMGNKFYDEWVNCVNGLSDWIPVFIAWWEVNEYRMVLEGEKLYPVESIQFVTPSEREKFLIEEARLRRKWSLSDEQVNWRRWAIVNLCNRSVGQFNQEYPDSWETAFLSTGDLFFNREALMLQEMEKPKFVGNVVREEKKYVFRQDPVGMFKVYELPMYGGQYVIGADPAEGLENRDKSAAVVVNKMTNNVVCVYNHNTPPDKFAEDLCKIGSYYNNAMIACENKGYGYAVNQDVYKQYGMIYRKVRTKKGFNEPTMDLGWNTNVASRPQMLSQLAEEIADGSSSLKDGDLIKQCWTFINNKKSGKPEAEHGKCDDLVMAKAIASQVRLEHPFKSIIKKKKTVRYRGLGGY